jgi:hypothetical protein
MSKLVGKKPESIASKIQSVINDAVFYQPSVIVLDDLDNIAAACPGSDQEMDPEAVYHSRVAEGDCNYLLLYYFNQSEIALVLADAC